MACCCPSIGASAEGQFSKQRATSDLARYRTKGPGATARLLLDGLAKAGPPEGRLLDVGSGMGALSFEFLDRELASAVGIDLSSAYVTAALDEAARRGRSEAVHFVHGDFAEVADGIPSAISSRWIASCVVIRTASDFWMNRFGTQIVLWRCRTRETSEYVRVWIRVQNVWRQIRRNSFRTFVHSASAM